MKKFMFFTFVLAIFANFAQAQTDNTPTFVTNTIVGKKFVWERVTEVSTSNVTVRRVDEVAPTPTFVTNVPPETAATVFYYKQYTTNRYGDGPGEVQPQAPGSIQWSSAQSTAGAQNYTVDQRPLDQGTQPASAVAHYATHQGSYATAPATYAVQSAYPVYAEYGSYYPVPHYPTYGYSYPSYGYAYPAYGYGVGYVSPRRLFGVSFDAVVSPAYSYGSGWVARGGHGGHHQSHQQNYPTYHSGGHHHRGGGR